MTVTTTASLEDEARILPRPVPAIVRVIYPPELTWQLRLAGEPVVLGRQPDDGTPALGHATVSRRHAQLWWDGRGQHAIRDLGSRHGTRAGDAVIGDAPRALRDGDVLRLGDVLAVYERLGEPDNAAVDRAMIPGDAAAIVALRGAVARAAADPSPALVIGETGSGKEWVARELHRLSGRPGPLVAVNCATLSRELAESQLFGHVRGAFTGATADHDGWFRQAHRGSLFLDELGELPLALQPKLLRVLQDGQVTPVGGARPIAVDVRVIAATNRELEAEVEAGTFRRDLRARLAKWTLDVPALERRRGDILTWLERLWRQWHDERHRTAPTLTWTASAAATVVNAPWPDNLRGLDRLVHSLASLGRGAIDLDDLPDWVRAAPPTAGLAPSTPPTPGATAPVTEAAAPIRVPVPSRDEFIAAWEQHGHSVRAVARHFSRDRRQIYRWLAAHGLRIPDDDEA
jgi:transcriptional regulator with GAF, ATPase, and Fis domain